MAAPALGSPELPLALGLPGSPLALGWPLAPALLGSQWAQVLAWLPEVEWALPLVQVLAQASPEPG